MKRMREYSMASHNRKNHQRWLNTFIREVNQTIAKDELWLGRFVVEQKATEMEWFSDGSGGLLYCLLQFRDKKTGRTTTWNTDCLEINNRIFWKMNDFITVDCHVWETEKPYEEVRNYRNVK